MAPPSATWLTKLKVQLKLAIARLRMVQQRDEQVGKTNRRAMAQLLEAGKIDSATIRVEGIIRADITSELHELLELYCELLLARAGLLESGGGGGAGAGAGGAATCDPGLEEAVKSLVYAAPRTEIRELVAVRSLLAEKFGKEFVMVAMDNADGKVSERVVRKLGVEPPRRELVQGYLEEIAKAYGVDWPKGRAAAAAAAAATPDLLDDGDGDDGEEGGGGGGKAAQKTTDGQREGEGGEGVGRDAPPTARLGEFKSPLTVTPPRMTTENVHPKVTLDSVELRPSARREDGGEAGRARRSEPEGSVPDISDLERRFAALKRR